MPVVGSSELLVKLSLVESVLLFFQFPVLPSPLLPVHPKGYKIQNVSCMHAGGKGLISRFMRLKIVRDEQR